MHGVMRLFTNFKEFYNDINGATLTGAIDVIVVEQPDGSYNCSPFHVRFGKLGVLRSREKVVDIEINGEPQDIHMKLGESGEAFFVEEIEDDDDDIPEHLATSPIPVSEFENLFITQAQIPLYSCGRIFFEEPEANIKSGFQEFLLKYESLEYSFHRVPHLVDDILPEISKQLRHATDAYYPTSSFALIKDIECGRRRSFNLDRDLEKIAGLDEPNDYTKRRYTGDNESNKTLERNFFKRQIGLGNLEVRENSTEDMTISLTSNKHSSEDLSRSNNDISETIFKMDSLDEISKADSVKEDVSKTPTPKNGELEVDSKSSKKKRRKMKKKNAPRKSKSINQMNSSQTSETLDKTDSATDRSSLDSNGSDPELKEINCPKTEEKVVAVGHPDMNTSYKKIEADFHFFSDTELTANGNTDSRADSPIHVESVQSDSEFEVNCRIKEDDNEDARKSWEWGGFPSISQMESPANDLPSKEQHRSMLSNMFSFMKTKHGAQQHLEGGIYLSDITSGAVDRDVAEIFFNPKKDKSRADIDLDCESGNGPSLQSPSSPEGCKSLDSDFEEQSKIAQSQDISISLCGWEPEPTKERFTEHSVKFSDLCNNPAILENPNLVVQIKDKFYTWKVASPIIASIMIFGRPLVQSSIDSLCNTYMQENKEGDKPPVLVPEGRYSWWNWRRGRTSREATPTVATAGEEPGKPIDLQDVKDATDVTEVTIQIESVSRDIPPRQTKDETNIHMEQSAIVSIKSAGSDKCKKTLRLSSKQIALLNLRDGMNEVEFSVTTAYQGTTRCQCHLYKWRWDDKIVISDIDGTITKSDVLGHILPIVGRDWAQSGVAQLFNKIANNGYKVLYLSARAIGQARTTREYLKSIRQGDLTMPDGPILLNPTSLITAFHREVIEKKPEQFKISCMSDIKALFPTDSNPFYAGYGNRINDVWAYRAVGIPIVRIFTINPKGELKHELTQTFQSSYSNMSYIVDQLFPSRVEAANDYSQFAYWRDPFCAIEEMPQL